jgi:hypothetical protein
MTQTDIVLRDYIRDWDPAGFIEAGYPLDEYDPEALAIRLEFDNNSQITQEQLTSLIRKTFKERLDLDSDNFVNECQVRSTEILRLLANHKDAE